MDVTSHEDSASEFCCTGSIFAMKLPRFVSKAVLTELVGQCRNILPLAFSVLTDRKGCGHYIPALTSHSVNKSIQFNLSIADTIGT